MSASLVGSEMCIRDSSGSRPEAVSISFRHLPALFGAVQHAELAEKRLKPVSYTHLTLPTICSV
eukprot:13730790-Alexandrium_andersonii.AAC.1